MKTSQLRATFLALPQAEAAKYTSMYADASFVHGSREAAWNAICEDPDNLQYMANILGDRPLRNRPAPAAAAPVSPDDRAAAVALAHPTATRAELVREVAAKVPKSGTFGNRTTEQLADAIYGRGRH